jgi:hypothetical protein
MGERLVIKVLMKLDGSADDLAKITARYADNLAKGAGDLRRFQIDEAADKASTLKSIMTKLDELGDAASQLTKRQKQLVEEAAEKAAESTKKLDDISDLGEKLGDKADEIVENIEDVAKTKSIFSGTQAKQFIRENYGKIALGLGVAGFATAALILYELKNGKKYNIIDIEDASTGSQYRTMFTIDTDQKFTNSGSCRIDDTNCDPIITPGPYKIHSVIDSVKIVIITKEKVKTKGTAGTFTYYTTFENELGGAVREAVKGTVAVGASIAKSGVGGVLEGLGLGMSEGTLNIIFYVILGVVAFVVGVLIFKKIQSKKENDSKDT